MAVTESLLGMRHGSHILTYLILLQAHNGGTINTPILKMRTVRHRGVNTG